MKAFLLKILRRFNNIRLNQRDFSSAVKEDEPLRAELFGAIQMEQHGRVLAKKHTLGAEHQPDQLLDRLAENENVIIEACNELTEAVKVGRQITPAAVWLLDNFYLIEEHIRTAKLHFPKHYGKELPKLLKGTSAGRPRVYDIVLELIAHSDGRIDPDNLIHFVSAYQEITVLKLGELWAIPIMLRLALIENLRRIANRVLVNRYNRNLADNWADKMVETAEASSNKLILLVADMARSNPPMKGSFIAELVRRFRDEGSALTLPLTWLSQRLAESGQNIDSVVLQESQQQAADQVSISNSIGSLRFLGSMDWREFVETMSVVDRILRNDPSNVYDKMDFVTRNQYRQVVEHLAQNSKMTEVTVAERAIELATTAKPDQTQDIRIHHVGYYLIGKGLPKLKGAVKFRIPIFKSIQTSITKVPLCIYLANILLLTLVLTVGIVIKAFAIDIEDWLLALVAVTSLVATSQLAISLVNWLITLYTKPCLLPRMDFSGGIPDESRTLVVVPSMLYTEKNVDHLIEAIEIRFLANQDANLRYCLLTDFGDAESEIMPADAELMDYAKKNIIELNLRYADSSGDNFFLFHRPRRWNKLEKIWMGYERKRGKLVDINVFLLHGISTAFSLIVGDTSILTNIKYVISLDTDTELPRDTARQFVATMAHPLNRVEYDAKHKRVVGGYGILQPRVGVSLPAEDASMYELLNSGDVGIDPYTRTVSDVYQDLFEEGSYIGKGIYDVAAYQYVLHDHMPENRILSHDLLEGCYIRSGLLSDVQLFEKFPSTYIADMKRRHRWTRGDWQIASWLLFRVPGLRDPVTNKHARHPNPLSVLSRWKLLDNLRRSVVPISLTTLVITGWLATLSPWFWTCVALGIYYIPPLCALLVKLFEKPDDVLFRQHISILFRSTIRHLAQATLTLTLLPFEAWSNIDAILRTHWRLLISHQLLLEWNPSGEESSSKENGMFFYVRLMWIAPLIALSTTFLLVTYHPLALLAAAPLLLLWWASPFIAYFISQTIERPASDLSAEQVAFLRSASRKEWLFFEKYVGPEDNWLPPDNVQLIPSHVIARRTSPTNIGLSLLANLAANDFGYLSVGMLLERSQHTLQTMASLERYQGHFFNWYHTQNLVPLLPNYVSTVDSGNLIGHLLVFQAGLSELQNKPIFTHHVFTGIRDTYSILRDAMTEHPPENQTEFEQDIESACQATSLTLPTINHYLERLTQGAQLFVRHFDATRSTNHQVKLWAHTLANQCSKMQNEFNFQIPWAPEFATNEWMRDFPQLCDIPTLNQLAHLEKNEQLDSIRQLVAMGQQRAIERLEALDQMVAQVTPFTEVEYDFLCDPTTHLLAIGYNATEHRRDNSFYDLLASEARLAVFVGIAQGKIPLKSWFALGRQLTTSGGDPILLSWSGSMFEYLMPLIVMPTFKKTLLDQTYKSAVARQIEYGHQRGVPWGISESGYYNFDTNLNYQYRAFGVPGLGFKRGLGDDLVIAPYASMMALMVAPKKACENLHQLATHTYEGEYGFYEAIDFTASRLPRGKSNVVIQSFMVHHQAMGFLSLAYLLLDRPMQRRFESIAMFAAIMPVLHERVPKPKAVYANTTELADIRTESDEREMPMRVIRRPDSPIPEVQLLSNGRYHVMVTSGGGGYSRFGDLSITRWREDTTRDNWGTFCYIRDLDDGRFWSTGFQPTGAAKENYEVIFSEGRAEFRHSVANIDMHTEIVVSPEDDVELRRTTIINRSASTRTIEITSYAEVVLATATSDALHPAFSNLFVQTEIIDSRQAIMCTRRPRSIDEKNPWMFHQMVVHDAHVTAISYETSRMAFIGRCNTPHAPQAMQNRAPLSGSQGPVLDPIVAIRYRITLKADQTATVDMITGITEARAHSLELIEKYQDRHLANRVIELAWTHGQVTLQQLNASAANAQLYNRLASSVVYVNPLLRAEADILMRNRRGQSGLWSYTISGDLPIVLVQIKSQENIELIHQLVQAHAYWSSRGLAVDLVIWNEDHAGYRQVLQEQILGMISAVTGSQSTDQPGGIFVRLADQISNEDRVLFQSVARIILTDSRGTLVEQVNRRDPIRIRVPQLVPSLAPASSAANQYADAKSKSKLILSNDLGGFTEDGREYVITTSTSHVTPAPWANVIANAQFGSVISESGQAYTWGENAHELRLTPWENDPVSDPGGEAFYIRDEETGHYWSPTPLPRRGAGDYITRHGFGYSVFEHTENGIVSELTVYVAMDAPVKYSVLQVHNTSNAVSKLSLTGYVEWVLGDLRSKSAMHIITELDTETGALLARNPYNTEFTNRVAFFGTVAKLRTVSGDRNEFIGRNGSLQRPAAMGRLRLSGKIGAGLDPCGALQIPLELAPGEQQQFVFVLGMADVTNMTNESNNMTDLIKSLCSHAAASHALEAVHTYWKTTLGAIQVNTPDAALNILANGWLMYQTIACRLWARSGYYQSSGAFGFRDQIQDCMALIHTKPQLLRDHLLLCAAHQFIEGDVLHWWHPPSERGVRTHCSDDFLWLPMAVHRYVQATADTGILDEVIHFIEGRQVNPNEDSYYDLPIRSATTGTLYQHCVRAIEHGLRFGVHGLSLMGSCDWNDAMSKVGEQGKGESIWLSFFFYDILINFTDIAISHNDTAFSERCHAEAVKLHANIQKNGWDGEWYLRAYFDDGTPLGSAQNKEGKIDSIAQSWSVLSNAGDPERSLMAMQAVERRLVRREDALIKLLDPPFNKSAQDPGYIRGYVPGVRENGGQYTHAAIWAAMAFAKMGNREMAWELMQIINPINHGNSAEKISTYKIEPYVIAADVYGVVPHVGRGGWSWYTGSAGWMYRLLLESLLGIHREGNRLTVRPCLPADWSTYSIDYRYLTSMYQITVRQSSELAIVKLDGVEKSDGVIDLVDDQSNHIVEIVVCIP